MTSTQIKAAQIAQIKTVLAASNNFKGKELTAATNMTYKAMQTEAAKRTPIQSALIQNFLRLAQA